MTESANEAVVGIEMVQAFGREGDVQDRFAERAARCAPRSCARRASSRSHLPGLFYCRRCRSSWCSTSAAAQVIDGTLSYGEFALFIQLLLQLVWPLESMGWIINLGQRALASAGRTFAWIERSPRFPRPRTRGAAARPLGIELRDVHFGYPGGAPVLRGVDLEVAPGEVRRGVRRDGGGQVDAARPRPALLRPDRGAVLLGGRTCARSARPTRARAVALVTQRPVLFSETLRENLLAGRDEVAWADVERGVRDRRRHALPRRAA